MVAGRGRAVSRARMTTLAQALAAYATLRAVGLVVAAVAAHRAGLPFWSLLGRYDGAHYLAIAQHGYDAQVAQPNGAPTLANPVFPPLFPLLIAIGLRLSPAADLATALAVAWLCGLTAAAVIYQLGARVANARTGVLLVALWAALPYGVVGSMVYSENLFTALAVGALLFALERRLLPAAALTALAGLTRPTAFALVVAVMTVAVVAAVRRSDAKAWLAALLAPLGLLVHAAFVAVRTRRWNGYFWLQDHVWRSRFDGGGDTVRTFGRVLATGRPFAYVVTSAVVVLAVVAAGFQLADRRVPWPLSVYAVTALLVVLGTAGYYYDKGRLLVPAVPLLLPLARRLASAGGRVQLAVVGVAAAFSAWYGAYLLTVWHYSP